tara:strand:- start:2222 stop:2713 length:492 start_codon:yes stop_codon:yes gene_type:complete
MTLFLSSSIKDIQLNNIICYDKIKNNIMSNSYFHKLVYSDELCSFNGIFFMFTMKNVNIEKYFNKLKCTISNDKENLATIKDILSLEKSILNSFSSKLNKYTFSYRIMDQLNNMCIKLQNQKITKYTNYKEVTFLIKISGIWSSIDNKEAGLTFKFFIINNKK